MQFTPGLGVCPFKNSSLQVRKIAGGFAGVTTLVSLESVVISNSSDSVVSICEEKAINLTNFKSNEHSDILWVRK